MSSKIETITPEELDQLVDEGKENVLQYFDLDNLRRGESKRINLDLPIDFLAALDREAALRGVTRQSLIKVWLYERLVPAGARPKIGSEIEGQATLVVSGGEGTILALPISEEATKRNPVARVKSHTRWTKK
jgi:hypothetical protein